MNGKIFLSYNHKDQPYALRIRQALAEAGWEVWMDVERMQSGESIEGFIENGIRQSGVTLTLISAHSLLSAWVAMETIVTQSDEKLRGRHFIPCYIDPAFFDRSFSSKAMNSVDENLQEIDGLMAEALQKGWGIEDLQSERTRYLKMKAHLPEIIGRLRNMLCINLAGDAFDAGLQKITADLQLLRTATQQAAPVVSGEQIKNILDEGERQRLQALQKRLVQLQQLQAKYEEELDFETDPKRQMRYEREISLVKAGIEKVMTEINQND